MSLVTQPLILIERLTTLTTLASTLFQTIRSTLQSTPLPPPHQSRALQDETSHVTDLLKALSSTARLENLSIAWERSVLSLDHTISQCTELVEEIFARIHVEGERDGGMRWVFTQRESGEYLRRLGRYKNTFMMVLEAMGG